ncbi:zeta toxin family protein [Chitinophaga sp. sic0106]|uniref:zeta toxin family protein n=1 Tax=Chitinophaga sp. sic0106 TaxID=2854785 RepID=UPI001C481DE4|nr:zeta toxin family protein [Chitinophaga sp. sic0106]MBV7533318.1 zeta toxin family protein [Chitinophaga sp. sic0106]
MKPDYPQISSSEQEAISNQIIAEETAELIPSLPPSYYLVGAQPGAGKTEIIHQIRIETSRNLLVCNADDFRERHPNAARILQDRESDFPDLTWPLADFCNTRLKKHGIANNLNILIETTLQDYKLVLADFERMKALGYRTHLLLLAVPSYMS